MADSETTVEEKETQDMGSKKQAQTNDPNSWMYAGLKEAVSEEMAQKDVLSWMNHKQFSIRKRKQNADWINILVAAVVDGDLEVHDGRTLVLNLREQGKSLKYSERLVTQTYKQNCDSWGVDATSGIDRVNSITATMTGISYAEACALEEEDRELISAISFFF